MNLGEVLRKWRLLEDLDLAEASKMLGIGSPATLRRIEQGASVSGETLASILTWLLAPKEQRQTDLTKSVEQ